MLNCVAIDDDIFALTALSDMCKNSPYARLNSSFISPMEFLKSIPKLDFDMCFLDICMPEMDGFELAKRLRNTPIIFVTGAEEELRKATDFSTVDILFKPVNQERFNQAVEKAYKLVKPLDFYNGNDYGLFTVAENAGKTKIVYSDIMYIESDAKDPRNKVVTFKDNKKLTIMGYSFKELAQKTSCIAQVNRSQAVSLNLVNKVKYDLIVLENSTTSKNYTREFTLNRKYRQRFNALMKPR